METIRAELASTLTGKRVADIDMGKSISRTPLGGVGLGFKAGSANGDIPSEAIFGTGSGDEAEEGPGLAELRRVVKERQQTRPEGIERQVKLKCSTRSCLALVPHLSVQYSREPFVPYSRLPLETHTC